MNRIFGLCLFGLVFLAFGSSVWAQKAELFTITTSPRAVSPAERVSPASIRESDIRLEMNALHARSAERLRIPLFDGETHEAVRVGGDVRSETDFAWFGKIDGNNDVILTFRDARFSGLIYADDSVYEIVAKGDRHILVELDQGLFPECYGDIKGPDDGGQTAAAPSGGVDSGDRIDVLVVYTTATKNFLGGTSQADTFAQSAVDSTNAVYLNSKVRQRLRLVHAQEFVFTETGNTSNDLASIRSNGTLAALRETHKADLVAMIAEVGDVCGIGYLLGSMNGSPANGFTITARSCAVGNLTFAHELGHNMGSHHNPENAGSAIFPYSYGHYVSGRFRTVMSYTDPCTGGCTRRPFFSHPGLFWNGDSMGVHDRRDNVRSLEQTADVIAKYRYSGSSVMLNSFNGGERLPRNISRTVNWTSDNLTGNVRIELSRDESRNWELLTTTANDGSATVNISGRPTRRARLRVVSVNSPAVSDSSVNNITIQ